MALSTSQLTLSPEAHIDLQLHTLHSDGKWTPEALLDHLVEEQFGLAAITDHDVTHTITGLQKLAIEKNIPLLVSVEMSTFWQGAMVDILCYGFDPHGTELNNLTNDLARRQVENTREVYENIHRTYTFPNYPDELEPILKVPGLLQPFELVNLITQLGFPTPQLSAGKIVHQAGYQYLTSPAAKIVEACHQDGGVCLIAHPGRDDGFVCFDAPLLDEFRTQFPIDGIEVYYPKHTPEQTANFLDYAQQNHLLISSGSDSHSPDNPPIKYPAKHSQKLLERLGSKIKE